MPDQSTGERILRAFLALAAERGMAAVTTRDIARTAGVNEVTIFRHFGDKAGLALAAVRAFQPVEVIASYRPEIDSSTSRRCAAGLARCLRMLYDQLCAHPELLQFGLADAARHPDLVDEVRKVPEAARRMLTAAFEQAAPRLRPEVDIEVEVLGLLGLLLMLATWRLRRWTHAGDTDIDAVIAARLRPLLRARTARVVHDRAAGPGRGRT
jgi:AcrR family transcriptional regulator